MASNSKDTGVDRRDFIRRGVFGGLVATVLGTTAEGRVESVEVEGNPEGSKDEKRPTIDEYVRSREFIQKAFGTDCEVGDVMVDQHKGRYFMTRRWTSKPEPQDKNQPQSSRKNIRAMKSGGSASEVRWIE